MNRQAASQTHQQAPAPALLADGLLERKCDCGQHTIAGGECSGCQNRHLSLQRAIRSAELETQDSAAVPPIVHDVLNSPGQPLDASTRAFMEPHFGHDFSRVRVHTDTRSGVAANFINARAFTASNEIVFGQGEYAPHTESGRRLISHELTHIVQQNSGIHLRRGVSQAGDYFERHADAAASEVMHGRFATGPLDQLIDNSPNARHDPGLQHTALVQFADPSHSLSRHGMRVSWGNETAIQRQEANPTFSTADVTKKGVRRSGGSGPLVAPELAGAPEANKTAAPCPVANTIVHVQNEPGVLIPALATARDKLRDLILSEPGNPSFKVTSEFRSMAYQAHFYSLRTTFIALNDLEGIGSHVQSARPQLRIAANTPYAVCSGLVDELNREIRQHALVPGRPDNAPSVSNPANPNYAAHTQGKAFDATIGGLSQQRITELAAQANLHRPYLATDPVHYELSAAGTINLRNPPVSEHPVRLAQQQFGATSPASTYTTSTPDPVVSPLRSSVKAAGQSKKATPAEQPNLFLRFVKMLRRLDKQLEGNATQAWGMIIHGEGDGRDSPATKASKDAKIWGSFDYAEFMKLMNLVLLAIPETLDYRKKLENFRDGLDPKKIFKDPQKAAEFFKEKVEEVVEIKKEFGDSKTKKEAGIPKTNKLAGTIENRQISTQHGKTGATLPTKITTTTPHRVEVGQWAASDLSGNTFVMIKYSDGSKRFVMSSIFGTRDIDDPGPLDWKKVRGPQSGTVQQAGTGKSSVPKLNVKQ